MKKYNEEFINVNLSFKVHEKLKIGITTICSSPVYPDQAACVHHSLSPNCTI